MADANGAEPKELSRLRTKKKRKKGKGEEGGKRKGRKKGRRKNTVREDKRKENREGEEMKGVSCSTNQITVDNELWA